MTASAASAKAELARCSSEGRRCLERRDCRSALSHFEKALQLGELPALNLCERWSCRMLLAEFEHAWRESDLADAWFPRPVPDTFGRLVIRCLRGLGDAIQFLRYVRLLRRRCRHIEVEAPAGLLPLLRCMRDIDEVVPMGVSAPLQPGDTQVECSDLPYLMRTHLDTIPPETVFDIPPRQLHIEGRGLRVAVVWASGDWNSSRSIPPEVLEPLSSIPNVTLYSLQRSPHGAGGPPLELPWLRNLEPQQPDILATAALTLEMDLVISVDTMVAHLAASLRRPVWLLLTAQSDWRWMLERTDTPWYRTMRLFRQKPNTQPGGFGNELVSRLTLLAAGTGKQRGSL